MRQSEYGLTQPYKDADDLHMRWTFVVQVCYTDLAGCLTKVDK